MSNARKARRAPVVHGSRRGCPTHAKSARYLVHHDRARILPTPADPPPGRLPRYRPERRDRPPRTGTGFPGLTADEVRDRETGHRAGDDRRIAEAGGRREPARERVEAGARHALVPALA